MLKCHLDDLRETLASPAISSYTYIHFMVRIIASMTFIWSPHIKYLNVRLH